MGNSNVVIFQRTGDIFQDARQLAGLGVVYEEYLLHCN
jgi:hypothetical protein